MEEEEEGRGLVPFSCPFRKCRAKIGIVEDAARLVYLAPGGREGKGGREAGRTGLEEQLQCSVRRR